MNAVSGAPIRWSLKILSVVALATFAGCSTVRSSLPQSRWSDQPTLSPATVVVMEGLVHPWAVAWLPDGRTVVTERDGRLWLASADGTSRTAVAGVPEVYAEGQGGLLDVSVAPRTVAPGWIYLAYAVGTREANRTEVTRFRLDERDGVALTKGELVFANNEYKSGRQHFGSRIAWLPDGTMLVSVGDGGNPPLRFGGSLQREQAQEPTTLFGNVVRLMPDGAIPDDNPFLGREGYRPEFYSMGNRNIQGIAVDVERNRVWASEHGSRGGDELNVIRGGENYGWPLVSHSREYARGTRISRTPTREGFADPQLVWLDTVAPSGLAVDGTTIYAGGLRSESVHVITVDDDGSFLSESVIPIGQRVRDVRIGPNGNVWVLTDDSKNGRLLRIEQ